MQPGGGGSVRTYLALRRGLSVIRWSVGTAAIRRTFMWALADRSVSGLAFCWIAVEQDWVENLANAAGDRQPNRLKPGFFSRSDNATIEVNVL